MKILRVNDLKSGIKFDKPVFIDDDNILVPAEVYIKEGDIKRLKKWGIESVRTEGSVIDEEAERLAKEESIELLLKAKTFKEIHGLYSEAVKSLNEVLNVVKKGKTGPPGVIDSIVNKLFDPIMEKPDVFTALTIRSDVTSYSKAISAVNCMILSLVIGTKLEMSKPKLMNLAIGALLHDVGMTRIPDNILNKHGHLDNEELQTIYTHTIHSYHIITKEFKYPEEIGLIAFQHHERWDGKGYPRGISGKDILLSARIVSVADSFEAMVRDRPYRDSMIGYTAIRQILNDNNRRFDGDIIKVFIKSLGIYPVGSVVILNDGSIGTVTKTHGSVPLRPEVRIIIDTEGNKQSQGEGEIIDLLENKALFIVRAINSKEIKNPE